MRSGVQRKSSADGGIPLVAVAGTLLSYPADTIVTFWRERFDVIRKSRRITDQTLVRTFSDSSTGRRFFLILIHILFLPNYPLCWYMKATWLDGRAAMPSDVVFVVVTKAAN